MNGKKLVILSIENMFLILIDVVNFLWWIDEYWFCFVMEGLCDCLYNGGFVGKEY